MLSVVRSRTQALLWITLSLVAAIGDGARTACSGIHGPWWQLRYHRIGTWGFVLNAMPAATFLAMLAGAWAIRRARSRIDVRVVFGPAG